MSQLLANWIPGPLLALGIFALVKREIGRLENFQDEIRVGLQGLKDKILEQGLMQRDFMTTKSHGESTARIYEEMRKTQEQTRERLLRLELFSIEERNETKRG